MTDTKLSASEIGAGIAAGRIDPVELTQAYFDAIDAHPQCDRIYARTTRDRALAEAEAARERAKLNVRASSLDGVPISWKDLYDTAGVATEHGSRLLAGRVPDSDAEVVKRATNAGMVCLGKTHQTELAFSGLGINPMTATPPNGIAPELAPGGSSSGAAVSVKLGMAAAGIGSDTGGSVRIPSVWNDLVGLKTTLGRLPTDGVLPLCARFDTIGPLCHTVEDAARIFAILDSSKAADLSGASLSGARFLVLDTPALAPLDDAPQAAFEAALARLSAAGTVLVHAASPAVEAAMPLSATLFTPEAYATWGEAIEADPDKMFGPVRDRFRAGKAVSGPQFVADWQKLDAARAAFALESAGFDAVLLPTAPILPPNTQRLLDDQDYFTARNLEALRNTRVGNLMGSCALTLPTETAHCGVMAIGRPMGEEHLLRLGAAMAPVIRP